MVLKLAEGVPMVWRTPTSLQFGIDAPRIVLDGVDAGQERMLAALRLGVSPSGWSMLARDAGLSERRARSLLATLEPVLQLQPAAASGRVLVLGDGPFATMLAGLLQDAGRLAPAAEPRPGERRPALVALVADWVIGPEDAQRWLRRDVPHLPVVTADRSVTVGPFVEPGSGPCLYCVQLARTDADPAWPAIATQLWGRPAARHSRLTVATVATFAARRIVARLDGGPAGESPTWRISGDGGTISAAPTRRHPRCSCAAPPESDWAPGAGRADPDVTRRARPVPVRA